MPRDYYEILGIERAATNGEISTAYRKLAVKYHPDRNPGDKEAIDRFKEAAEAFEVLNDSDKRSRYDRFGHAGLNGSHGAHHFNDVEDIFSAFGDLFGDLFGGGGGGRGSRNRPQKGRDVRCDVTLTLKEAANGVTKKVEFQRHERCEKCSGSGAADGSRREVCSYCRGQGRVIQAAGIVRIQTTCPQCHGEGSVIKHPCTACRGSGQVLKKVTTEVQIPPGVDDEMRVRITGEGEPSLNGGPPGDCYCFISVLPHALFERDGQHLVCRVPITYAQAALGATLEVPTLEGRGEVEIPAGTQSGGVFKLGGKGMPDPRRRGLGDLLVQVIIEVPKKLSKEEKSLLRELAELEHKNVAPERKSFFAKLKDYFTADEEEKSRSAD
ncbi:MAG TPA: molecular chaperone DnaJ [Lacipirellulaceae bacterium]|jgi:molecular chaperone DnaJ|nr:molecular chaperone DnaJ [Lacipirellulaceae bacterium]